jgi:dTDP-4-dehydrorhamnose reductase
MTILVFGSTGQVARELAHFSRNICLEKSRADLTSPTACSEIICQLRPKAVINAAAYTDVDKAEKNEARALLINGDAPTAMANTCAKLGIPFVHISTDYVFDGKGKHSRMPDEPTAPLGAYGRSKLRGEKGIQQAGGIYVILRTSWVFSEQGTNFVKAILTLAETQKELRVVSDQFGGPTPAKDIAIACQKIATDLILGRGKSGTYHFSGEPDLSWAEFAREILWQTGKTVSVKSITSAEYQTLGKRPKNSRIDCTSLYDTFGIVRSDWKVGLRYVIDKLGSS